ncbi:hypothetical protein OEZ86_000491 [Tetradesmus obliquus]|nr:hypothetical protein OEZ86_000491 [Tetradesmus obliquus]
MTNLQSLVLSGVGISGPLDNPNQPGLESFPSLRHLDLSQNPGITSELPSSWYVLHKLQALDISHTGVTGTLPAAYAALQQLREFRAANCTGINGQLPVTWGLLNLEVLEEPGRGGLAGSLPGSFAAMTQLQVLMLSGHAFNGTLPPSWTRLQQLRVLDLSRNSLGGNLPSWYVSMRKLAVLKVQNNRLMPSGSSTWEFYEYLLAGGTQLQCLCVAGNAVELVDAAAAARLQGKAQGRKPPVELVIDAPGSSACDPAPFK